MPKDIDCGQPAQGEQSPTLEIREGIRTLLAEADARNIMLIEVGRVRTERDEALSKVEALEAEIARLREYARSYLWHNPNCSMLPNPMTPCDCGMAAQARKVGLLR
jgi:hypothetical protein